MKILAYFVFFIGIPLLFLLFVGSIRSWQVSTDPRQRIFLNGVVPTEMPEGLYKGKIEGRRSAWKGKEFNSQTRVGVNIVNDKKDFPFMFYKAYGLQDPKKEVLRIDYGRKDNPFWLRLVRDEVVQIKKDEFLGKIHVVIPPHIVFTLGYFTLEK